MIVISTDSGSDLTKAYAQANGVYLAPMYVIMDGVEYKDGHFPVEKIFEYYDRTKKIPSTSGVGVSDYTQMFEQIQAEHPGCTVLHISYSAVTTVSYQNAMIAREHFENIYVMDAKNVSVGLGLLVRRAVELAEQYEDGQVEQLIARLEDVARRLRFSFIPDTLDYLLAGGRISNVAYIGANLLRLKPLIKLDNGYLVAAKKYRGRMRQILSRCWADFMAEGPYELDIACLCGVPGVDPGLMAEFEGLARAAGFRQVIVEACGGVISCHGGPAAIGMAAIRARD